MGQTGVQGVKQRFKVSNKLMSTVVTLTLFKVHANPYTGQWMLRRGLKEQGRKRPLDTPKRMIKRREREGNREKER